MNRNPTTNNGDAVLGDGEQIIELSDIKGMKSNEKRFLNELYVTTGGQAWVLNHGWHTSEVELKYWSGVTLGSEDGCVRALQLQENNLSGDTIQLEMISQSSYD